MSIDCNVVKELPITMSLVDKLVNKIIDVVADY